jgi:hypothetical protein
MNSRRQGAVLKGAQFPAQLGRMEKSGVDQRFDGWQNDKSAGKK